MLSRLRRRGRAASRRKLEAELGYWRSTRETGGYLEQGAPYYEWAFTTHFGLDREFYRAKKLLDVGCGPRGSLEWADDAAERVGIDPLADEYARLQSRTHRMTYRAAPAEQIPFPDGHFDVVSTFNSLDHVDDLGAALREIARVARPGGTLLLVVDINHGPTINEPQRLEWTLVDRLLEDWNLAERRDLRRGSDNLLENLVAAEPFDHEADAGRPGVLSARLERRGL